VNARLLPVVTRLFSRLPARWSARLDSLKRLRARPPPRCTRLRQPFLEAESWQFQRLTGAMDRCLLEPMARALSAFDVFTPSSFPEHTYVPRDEEALEKKLRFALGTKGQIVSVSGPSKSGKTVLVERVVGKENLIPIVGAGIRDPEHVWTRILDWMDTPTQTSSSLAIGSEVTATAGAKAEAGVLVAKAEVSGELSAALTGSANRTRTTGRRGLQQVVDEIANSDFVVLIDDFHYMDRSIQIEAAKQLKEAARLGVKIVTAAVPYRADDVVRANPELRGRVSAVDVDYWRREDLARIGQSGFNALNAAVGGKIIEKFASESAGSPQLMQAICLFACSVLAVQVRCETKTDFAVDGPTLKQIYASTTSVTDFRSLVQMLVAGPKTRGTERKMYQFSDSTEGDVYRCILKSVAAEPLRLSFDYDDILRRVREVCVGDPPVGSSIVGSCNHMSRIAQEQMPPQRVIDWDEDKSVLDIPDPYLLFYLRWSGALLD